MFFNRNPRFRHLNKINGFFMVVLAGMFHRFGQGKDSNSSKIQFFQLDT